MILKDSDSDVMTIIYITSHLILPFQRIWRQIETNFCQNIIQIISFIFVNMKTYIVNFQHNLLTQPFEVT